MPHTQLVTVALSPGVMWKGREAEHSLPTSVNVKKTWIYTATPPYSFSNYVLDLSTHSRAPSGLAPTIYREALLRVSPQDTVILPHHNIMLNALLKIAK
jgi:hypothetical protein